MVDNRGISSVSGSYFKPSDAMANKMSEEKYGQGGEYQAQQQAGEDEEKKESFQDRSAQLRASLSALAARNAGSIRVRKITQEKKNPKEELINYDEVFDD